LVFGICSLSKINHAASLSIAVEIGGLSLHSVFLFKFNAAGKRRAGIGWENFDGQVGSHVQHGISLMLSVIQ